MDRRSFAGMAMHYGLPGTDWPDEPGLPGVPDAPFIPVDVFPDMSPEQIQKWLSEPIGPLLPADLQAKQDAWLRARQKRDAMQLDVDTAVVARDKADDDETDALRAYIDALEDLR